MSRFSLWVGGRAELNMLESRALPKNVGYSNFILRNLWSADFLAPCTTKSWEVLLEVVWWVLRVPVWAKEDGRVQEDFPVHVPCLNTPPFSFPLFPPNFPLSSTHLLKLVWVNLTCLEQWGWQSWRRYLQAVLPTHPLHQYQVTGVAAVRQHLSPMFQPGQIFPALFLYVVSPVSTGMPFWGR